MKRIVRLAALLVLFVSIVGCSTLTRQQIPMERPLPEAEHKPLAAELKGDPITLWLLAKNDGRDGLRVESDILQRWKEKLRKAGIQLKQPPAAAKGHMNRLFGTNNPNRKALKDFIETAELNRSGEYAGQSIVDYILEVNMNRSNFEQTYSDPIWCPVCEDKRPGSCEYTLEAHFDLKLKPLPEYRTLKSFWLESSENDDFDTFRCPTTSQSKSSMMYQNLRRDIVEDIADCGGHALATYLTPTAYVLNYYSDGKVHYFEISGGAAAGFVAGQKVQLGRVGELGRHDVAPIGEAKVATLVEPTRAIIEVTEPSLVEKIRKYDQVKVIKSDIISDVSCTGKISRL